LERARRFAVSANVSGSIINSVVGPSADIHPTARVENSLVGGGARIGARAYVKDSILGDSVVVGDCTKFNNCVVGDRCHSLSDSYFSGCTFYPDSTLANVGLFNSVIGRNVFLTTAVICLGESTSGPVSVFHDGGMRPTGRFILGSCLGHDTMLGTRAIFMPGLALPNGVIVVMPPGEGVHKVPSDPDPSVPLVWDGGKLKPLTEVFPGYLPPEFDSPAPADGKDGGEV
jgi:NDP-sugar pyrophosphorylase family protein